MKDLKSNTLHIPKSSDKELSFRAERGILSFKKRLPRTFQWVAMTNSYRWSWELTIPDFLRFSSKKGFTLLEILVAVAILGIAVTVVLQLFSANLRALSASDDYITAVIKAEAKMREILDNENISEQSYSETTYDGYRMDVFITDTLKERTENLNVSLLEIDLITSWVKGSKTRSITLKTLKVIEKKVGQ